MNTASRRSERTIGMAGDASGAPAHLGDPPAQADEQEPPVVEKLGSLALDRMLMAGRVLRDPLLRRAAAHRPCPSREARRRTHRHAPSARRTATICPR